MATHGSLTKAGKVRGQTPKVEGRKIVGTNSKLRNKSNFRKRFVLAEIGLGGKNAESPCQSVIMAFCLWYGGQWGNTLPPYPLSISRGYDPRLSMKQNTGRDFFWL